MASSWWLLHTVPGRCVPPRQGTAGVHRWGPSTHRPLEPLRARRNLQDHKKIAASGKRDDSPLERSRRPMRHSAYCRFQLAADRPPAASSRFHPSTHHPTSKAPSRRQQLSGSSSARKLETSSRRTLETNLHWAGRRRHSRSFRIAAPINSWPGRDIAPLRTTMASVDDIFKASPGSPGSQPHVWLDLLTTQPECGRAQQAEAGCHQGPKSVPRDAR